MRTFEHQAGAERIVFGAGTMARLGAELERLGGRRALVLSTPEQQDLAARVVDHLSNRAAGIFSEAAMHTPVEVTEAALARVKDLDADSVVAVGGGSTTGLGKAIASRTGLPHLVLPTTYAGSEVTPVLGETDQGEKLTRSAPEILPDTVIYDVELTLTLPWDMTVTSAVNAIAHSAEALYSDDRSDESDRMAFDSITALAQGLRQLQDDHENVDARADLLYGAWLAGTCLGTVGMGLHHKLCHTLGGSFGLPHAQTHTVVLPYALEYNEPAAEDAVRAVATALDVSDAPAGLQGLVHSWGGPKSLAELGFSREDVDKAAALATARPYPNPREVTRRGITDLLTRATDGTQIGENR